MPAELKEKSRRAVSGRDDTTRTSRTAPLKTAAIWAVGFFLLVNGALWLVAGGNKEASDDLWSGTKSIDLALNDYAELKTAPDVVLLGSSLMMYPFWTMDREISQHIPDIFHHHRSRALEKMLAGAGGKKSPSVFSMAIFGQMSSDAFIYVNDYLKGKKTPQVLIWGIAPRDFSDSDLPRPMATLTFKRLIGLANFGRYANLYLPTFKDKADFLMTKACFFYGRRWRLQQEVGKAASKAYGFAGIAKEENSRKRGGESKAGFMLNGSHADRWMASEIEYKRRYKDIDSKDLSVQLGFMKRLLLTCRQRGIKVIVVNMPLTDINRNLMPAVFYEKFRKQIGSLALSEGAEYVDVGSSPEFIHEDFWDTAHLNHKGGHKLMKHVVPVTRRVLSN